MSERKFANDVLLTFSVQIFNFSLAILSNIITARTLGPFGKGSYSLIVLVSMLLVTVSGLGIGLANTYFVGNKKHAVKDIASNSIIFAFISGIIIAAIFIVYYYLTKPSYLADVDARCLVIALFAMPFFLAYTYLQCILLGVKRIKHYNAVTLTQPASFLVLLVILLITHKANLQYTVIAWVISVLGTTIISFILLRRVTGFGGFKWRVFKDSVAYGVKGHIGNILGQFHYRLIMFLVGYYLGNTFVGYYSVAVSLAETLWFFPGAVGTILFASTTGLSKEEANQKTPKICRTCIFITAITALILLALSKYIINILFGKEYIYALGPFTILLFGVLVFTLSKVLANELNGRGRPIIGTIAAAIALTTNIIFGILLIPRYGMTGAALASTVSYSIDGIVVLIAFTIISKVSVFDTLIIKRSDICSIINFVREIRRNVTARVFTYTE